MKSATPTPSSTAEAITQATTATMAGNVAAHRTFQRSTRHAWRFHRRHKRLEQLCFLSFASNRNCLAIPWSGRRNDDRFNSHCREQSGVAFSSMGPLPRRPWSAFQARKVLKQHSLTIVRIIRKVAILVEFSSLVKMRPWLVFIVWLSPLKTPL